MTKLRSPFDAPSPCEKVTWEQSNTHGASDNLAGYYNHYFFLDWYQQEGNKLKADLYRPIINSQSDDLRADFSHLPFTLGDWVPLDGDKLLINVIGNSPDYKFESGDQLLINVDCPKPEQKCDNHWKQLANNELNFHFKCCDPTEPCNQGTWKQLANNELNFHWVCCGEQQGQTIVFGTTFLYTGESLDALLENDIRLGALLDHGEEIFANFTTVSQPRFNARLGHGETIEGRLDTKPVLVAELEQGQILSGILRTAPVAFLQANLYHGENLTGKLQTTATMAAVLGVGEELSKPNFSVYQSVAISADISHGEAISGDLKNDIRASANLEHGEAISGDLFIKPDQGLKANLYHGENLEAGRLHSPIGFKVDLHQGETIAGTLKTESSFEVLLSYGETLSADLKQSEKPLFDISLATGDLLSASLTLGASRFPTMLFYQGEILTAALEHKPAPGMVSILYHGEEISTPTLRKGENLGNLDLGHGQILTAQSLEETPNEYFYHGESLTAALWTETRLSTEIAHGENVTGEFSIRPSEPLGVVSLETGESLTGQLKTMKSANLAAFLKHDTEIMAGIGDDGVGTYLDLTVRCCCPEQKDPNNPDFHRIELEHTTPATFIHNRDANCLISDLHTRQRFSVDLYHGESVDLVPKDNYLSASLGHGESLSAVPESKDIDFNLCPGNFVPHGDNVYFELETPDNFDCEVYYLHEGQSLKVNSIRTEQAMQAHFGEGQTLNADLTINPPFRAKLWHGEHLRAWDGEMKARLGQGESLEAEIYEPNINIYHGEALEGNLVIQYDVEFLEQGCLDNEHIPQTPDGDPDWKKYTPVPIELEEYRHDIKARCY